MPNVSKNKINKAGQVIVDYFSPGRKIKDWEQLRLAVKLVNEWRACHAYPINTFQSLLRKKLKKYTGSPFASQRLKRLPTIIDKLSRYSTMNLTQMQDIGGLRAVLDNIEDVYKLEDEYLNKTQFAHTLDNKDDYIRNPRSEDGYRSIHLIYKYKNKLNPGYDGLKLELQIRTKLQHIWANAVETMGTFLGQALKSRKGETKWLDFFALVSSAFAYKEKSEPIPRFKCLSKQDTYEAIVKAEKELNAINIMIGLSAVPKVDFKGRWFYHLVVLDSLNNTTTVYAYDRNSYEKAIEDYSHLEEEALDGKKIEPVLVSAGQYEKLRKAYPSFFLDISEFLNEIQKIKRTVK